ncbi:hypothetical protein PVAP13_3NG176765 [Panicum virgatum]|uniref:Acid phosphatase n=1 Tax=Panicum virgatum TaxID=38727 RepID=A0A8T0U1K8_PANVG|nr:hypothetical protein PVAP13_3NG176765 [Panicum virgatum]
MRDWKTVPADCEGYVGHYIYAGRALPRQDSLVVVDEAIAYAEGLELGGGGREVWVFDLDETSLSNLPYYAKHGFGTKPYNAASFNEYVLEGSAPALPETQRLFRKLIALGVKPVFLTGRTEDQRAVTVANLRRQGYSGWKKRSCSNPSGPRPPPSPTSPASAGSSRTPGTSSSATSGTSGATSSARPTPSTTSPDDQAVRWPPASVPSSNGRRLFFLIRVEITLAGQELSINQYMFIMDVRP